MSYQWRYRCLTEGSNIQENRNPEAGPPQNCVNNPGHSIDTATIVLVKPLDDEVTIAYDSIITPVSRNRIIRGDIAWDSGLTFNINPLLYNIGNELLTTTATQVTLANADITNDRIDLIYVDNTGTVDKITGTPSATPVPPLYDFGQIILSQITVPALSGTPDVSIIDVYLENTEWTVVENTGGSNFNLASATDPKEGSVSIEGTSVGNNDIIQFTNSATINPERVLEMNIKNKSSWVTTIDVEIRLYNGTKQVGRTLKLSDGEFGFNRASIIYQTVLIPIHRFEIDDEIDKLTLTWIGTGTVGFYLDRIRFQNGFDATPIIPPDITATNIGSGSGLFKQKLGKKLEFLSITSTGGIDITTTTDSIDFSFNAGTLDHNSLSNLTVGHPHTQYLLVSGDIGTGDFNFTNTTESLSTNTGVITTQGGLGVAKRINNAGTKGDLLAGNGTTMIRLPAGIDGQLLASNSSTSTGLEWVNPGAGSGEVNDGTNIGTGTGVFAQKAGLNLQFRTLESESTTITLTSDGSTISLDVNATAIDVGELNVGLISHNALADLTVGHPHTQYMLTAGDTGTGDFIFTNTTVSTDSSTGVLVIEGGVGIQGDINIGSDSSIDGILTVGSTLTVAGDTNISGEINSAGGNIGDTLFGNGTTLSVVTVGTNESILIADSSQPNGVRWDVVNAVQLQGFDITSTTPSSGEILKYNGTIWSITSEIFTDTNKRDVVMISPIPKDITDNTYSVVGSMIWDNTEYSGVLDPRTIFEVAITTREMDVQIYDSINLTPLSTMITTSGSGFYTLQWTKPVSTTVVELQARKNGTGGPKAVMVQAQFDFQF